MRILLDENVHHGFRKILIGHEVFTVQYMGWSGIKNGKLLELANEKFDILITLDTGIMYENNLDEYRIAVITMISKFVRMDDLMPMIPRLLSEIASIRPGNVVNIYQNSRPTS